MLSKTEIKETILNLGIKDLDTYSKWLEEFWAKDESGITVKRLVTQADIDLLSPDNVDNNAFWQVAEEMFGADPVSSCKGGAPNNYDDGNKRNINLARMTGALNFVDYWSHIELPILEIGAGYGNFKSYVMVNTEFRYTGVDVYPRVNGVLSTTPEGFLAETVKNQTYPIVYSSNVFQHLSKNQRSRYFEDVSKLLDSKGVFVFNLMVHQDNPANPKFKYSEDGRRYLIHYGQFTEIPYLPELYTELDKYFYILYETKRYSDSFFTFHCKKRDL